MNFYREPEIEFLTAVQGGPLCLSAGESLVEDAKYEDYEFKNWI